MTKSFCGKPIAFGVESIYNVNMAQTQIDPDFEAYLVKHTVTCELCGATGLGNPETDKLCGNCEQLSDQIISPKIAEEILNG